MAYREKNKYPSSRESSNTSSSETDEDFLSAARSINPELGLIGNEAFQESSNDMAPNGTSQGGSSPIRGVIWPGKPMARKQTCMKSDMAVIRRHLMGSSKVTETKPEVKSINKEENFSSPDVMEITQGVQSLKLEDISTCAMAYRHSKEQDFNTGSSENEEESLHAGRNNQQPNVIQPAKISSEQRESVAQYVKWFLIIILCFLMGITLDMYEWQCT